eukprot:s45_g43.t1
MSLQPATGHAFVLARAVEPVHSDLPGLVPDQMWSSMPTQMLVLEPRFLGLAYKICADAYVLEVPVSTHDATGHPQGGADEWRRQLGSSVVAAAAPPAVIMKNVHVLAILRDVGARIRKQETERQIILKRLRLPRVAPSIVGPFLCSSNAWPRPAIVGRALMDDLDDLDDFDDELEELSWSWRYVSLCLLIPTLNGFINGYCWAGLSLHYREMGWSIARVGTASTFGFIGRIVCQKIQVRYGFWVMIPLGLIHLILTITGVIFFDQEWAVILEVAALQSLDGAITNEGLAFDAFGRTEDLARQAAATVLAMFTISGALSVPIAGALYDNVGGWQSMSIAHLGCQGLLFILLEQKSTSASPDDKASSPVLINVVPGGTGASPAKRKGTEEDMQLEDVENLPGQVLTSHEQKLTPAKQSPTRSSVRFSLVEPETASHSNLTGQSPTRSSVRFSLVEPETASHSNLPTAPHEGRERILSDDSSVNSDKTDQTPMSKGARRRGRNSFGSGGTNMTGLTMRTGNTARTTRTAQSGKTLLSRIANLKDSDNFQYHPGAMATLEPRVARRSGLSSGSRLLIEEEAKSIPKDTILPSLMISLCCFNNTVCYIIELGTFVLFFKEYHGWNSAMGIGFAQSAGDLSAAFVMKLLPSGSDGTSGGVCRRIFMQPYNLSWLVMFWVLCNLGMASPWLAAAVTAQVLMGSLFVYNAKFTTDLNLFYSLGDNGVFLTMQVWCKTAHAIGACCSSFLGPLIYSEVSPVAPFLVATGVSAMTFVSFSAFFAFRVGLLDIESAEEQRARRKGKKRVSAWASDRKSVA